MRSIGIRFILVGGLALLMYFPLLFIAELARERKDDSTEIIREVGQEWGGRQSLLGPVLHIPVERHGTRFVTRDVVDPVTGNPQLDENGRTVRQRVEVPHVERVEDLYLLPETLDIEATSQNQIRYRGIYEVPVYTTEGHLAFSFDLTSIDAMLDEGERPVWDESRLDVRTSTNRSIRGRADLQADGQVFALNPLDQGVSGMRALVGDPRGLESWTFDLQVNGAELLSFNALGRQTEATIRSDWQHPSFDGYFLPTSREVGPDGFVATWSIPHLARNVSQQGRGDFFDTVRARPRQSALGTHSWYETEFGVAYFTPNSFYKKAFSASRYSLLFIALTFLTVMLMTGGRTQGVHPVQYLLIGLAKGIFVLLMLAYAEHLGFTAAFGIAATATIALLTFYGWAGLKLGGRTWGLFALLVLVYAVLLQSQDFALLAGGTLAFFALAAAMFFTRDEQWFQPPGDGDGWRWFGAKAQPAVNSEQPPS